MRSAIYFRPRHVSTNALPFYRVPRQCVCGCVGPVRARAQHFRSAAATQTRSYVHARPRRLTGSLRAWIDRIVAIVELLLSQIDRQQCGRRASAVASSAASCRACARATACLAATDAGSRVLVRRFFARSRHVATCYSAVRLRCRVSRIDFLALRQEHRAARANALDVAQRVCLRCTACARELCARRAAIATARGGLLKNALAYQSNWRTMRAKLRRLNRFTSQGKTSAMTRRSASSTSRVLACWRGPFSSAWWRKFPVIGEGEVNMDFVTYCRPWWWNKHLLPPHVECVPRCCPPRRGSDLLVSMGVK